MTERQLLWRVELPLAMPEIIAGLRIATVSTVAIATLAVFAGAGGLGDRDLHRTRSTLQDRAIVVGGVARDRDGDRLRRPAASRAPAAALAPVAAGCGRLMSVR